MQIIRFDLLFNLFDVSNRYKFHDPDGIYFITLVVVDWIDVFTRNMYKDEIIDSLKYCQTNKGLVIHAWVIVTNHLHLIISRNGDQKLQDILRDFKKFTAYKLLGSIMNNRKESRSEWMLERFELHGKMNSNNSKYQFWRQDNHPILLDTNILQNNDWIISMTFQ